MQNKFCPLMGHGPAGLTWCKREYCAWWIADRKKCAFVSAAIALNEMLAIHAEIAINR